MIIHKYTLEVKRHTSVEMPQYAKILSIQNQNENLVLWALINKNNPIEKRDFLIIMTGEENEFLSMEKYGRLPYLATIQFDNRTFVAHVFENIYGYGL